MTHLKKYLNPAFLLLLCTASVSAQDYDFEFKTLPKPPGITKLILTEDCFNCTPARKNDTSYIYTFNTSGKIIHSESFSQGKTKEIYRLKDYSYNPDNTLKSIKDYGHWDYGTFMDTPVTPVWDSTYINRTENYYYENGQLMQHTVSRENGIPAFETSYFYDAKKNIRKEIKLEHVRNYSWQKDTVMYRKEYISNKTITTCRYYENDSLKGKETISKNAKGQIIKSELKDNKGNPVKKVTYNYNTKGQIASMQIKNTGTDEYGQPSGSGIGNHNYVYTYDEKGYLVKKDEYYEGGLFITKKLLYQIGN